MLETSASVFISSSENLPGGIADHQGDVILTSNIRLNPTVFHRFIRSLRAHNPSCEVVAFVADPLTDETAAILRKFRGKYIVFNESALPTPAIPHETWIHRFTLWRRYLEGKGHLYKRVFLCDSRDVVFQDDPFSRLPSSLTLQVFVGETTVGQCPWNANWTRDCFGELVQQQLADYPLANAGTSIGTYTSIMEYVYLQETYINSARCTTSARDNVILNLLVYSGIIQKLEILNNSRGWLGTLMYKPSFIRNRYGEVLNEDRVPYAVLHQYDRHQWLSTHMDQMYPYNVDHEKYMVFYPHTPTVMDAVKEAARSWDEQISRFSGGDLPRPIV